MLLDLEEKTRVLVEDIVERSAIGRGAIFVLGLSSSEVAGGTIGKASNNNNCLRRFLLRSQEKQNPIKKGPTL